MATSSLLQLRTGVEIFPASRLSADLRQRLGSAGDDYAVSIPNTRHRSSLINPATADLLGRFRRPSTLAQAVREFAGQHGEDPATVLRQAWDVLESLLRRGVLLQIDDPRLTATPPLDAGGTVGAWTVVRPVQQLEDTEIYLVRSLKGRLGALKIRCAAGESDRRIIQHEADILDVLDGSVAPRKLDHGKLGRRPYLVSEWHAGVDAETVARRWRSRSVGAGDRRRLLALCREIARTYARLHAAGVLHADIHPGNLLVDSEGRIRLIDFGLSGYLADGPLPFIGGNPFYYAPETARALLDEEPTTLSPASEQFSVAALLYRLLTGHPYRDFHLEQDAQLRQAAEAGMRPFRHRDLVSWPAVEAILERALGPEPAQRFTDMAALERALPAIALESPSGSGGTRSHLHRAQARVRSNLPPGGNWWREGLRSPTASVQSGAAGIALACYRMASLSDDAELLSLADLWIRRARQQVGHPEAFEAADLELTAATVGESSPYHTESGVHAVEALVANAQGQTERRDTAVCRFLEAGERPGHGHDLTLGTASHLVVSAALLEVLDRASIREPVIERGERALSELWSALDQQPAIVASFLDHLGLAHGWAGFLYASLRWRQAADGPMPASLEQRLEQLAGLAEPWGRGLRWPWFLGPSGSFDSSMPGWCNGSAGHLMLWSLANRTIGDRDYADLERGAAMDVWDAAASDSSLCCGLVGRAYALLSRFRHGGDRKWLRRARDLAEAAARLGGFGEAPAYSLFKGELALALIAADLERPDVSCFPWLEAEGW